MLGPGNTERGLQETLTDSQKLELIRAKFAANLSLYASTGAFIGSAHRVPGTNEFVFVPDKGAEEVYFYSVGAIDSRSPVRALKHPVFVANGDTLTVVLETPTDTAL